MLAWSFMQFWQTQVFVFGGSVLPIHFKWYHSKHASQPIAWRLFSTLSHALQSHVFSFLTFLSSDCTVFQAPLVKCFFTRNTLIVSSRIFFGIFSGFIYESFRLLHRAVVTSLSWQSNNSCFGSFRSSSSQHFWWHFNLCHSY